MCKAKKVEDVREELLDQIRAYIGFWINTKDQTEEQKLVGLAFSILNIFDGTSACLPAMDIVLRPHEDDKEYNKENGDDWYEDGMVVNECMLHEQWCNKVD